MEKNDILHISVRRMVEFTLQSGDIRPVSYDAMYAGTRSHKARQAMTEEAAERARRNDSVAGRVKNTAISTATRQVVSSLTKNVTKAIENLFGGKKR